MNKSLDERLVPNGEYIDALNVRVGSTELSEIGSVENTKGNERLTTLNYTTGGTSYSLSTDAKCIGAYEDGANETIYWFITDPSSSAPQATGKLDMIVSYNTNNESVTYHVISVDDGGGVNTTLNFNSQYLITGVDKVDNLLFFTDNLNQPRFIDVESSYPYPISNIDGGSIAAADLLAESLLVVKKPPVTSPSFVLEDRGTEQNFLEDRFICFAYRYRYANDQYSATSQFSNPAFIPKKFNFDNSSYLNEGMENFYDTAVITFNTGSELVVGIDLLFKEASNAVIRVIEKLDKEEMGYADNQDVQYEFSNNKIYTVLDDAEILRLYDNVPIKAKAQTIMGSRLVYGNYVDGFDLVDSNNNNVKFDYNVEYISEEIGLSIVPATTSNGVYDIDPGSLGYVQTSSEMDINLSNRDLVSESRINISVTFTWGSFTGSVPSNLSKTTSTVIDFAYIIQQDFATVQDLQFSQDFGDKIGRSTNIQPILDACDGVTFTDLVNCAIPLYKVDGSGNVWTKTGSGITAPGQGMSVLGGALDHIRIKLPASVYSDGVNNVYEYYEITNIDVSFQKISQTASLHSNRDYEVGMIYMDEFNRSTTVLVDFNNIIHLPCSSSDTKNNIRVTVSPDQKPPAFATRYKFAIKQDREIYETIYSNIYFIDVLTSDIYFLLEGENAQKVSEGDILYIKADSSGPLDVCRTVTVLEKKAQESEFIEDVEENIPPAGVYMKIRGNVGLDFTRVRSWNPGGVLATSSGGPLFRLTYKLFNPGLNFDGFGNLLTDQTITKGSTIRVEVRVVAPEPDGGSGAVYELDEVYTSNGNYTDIIEWWNSDNIGLTLGEDDQGGQAFYIDTLAPTPTSVGLGSIDIPYAGPRFRWYKDSSGKIYLLIGGYNVTASQMFCRISILTPGDVIIFETEPQDAAPDIWYESPVSYPITNGFHEGNVQNQTAILPAIVDTEFQNCFSFGNGAESYKIRDSITRKTFGLGNRVSSVLKGEEFKEEDRFSNLTYSGVYSFNVNNLNEFNLGLLNFKELEPSFGLIQKLFARATDILVLQEDKISYVLAGKNLLSDSAAGGAVTSVPEVLGTQIARIEEYGISNNPESFAQYGYDKYFTDSKRGVLLQLKGASYNNDQLIVVSNFGMSSWFRDLFLEDGGTQKLGGYDPFMKEYVLSSNERILPFEAEVIEGGIKKKSKVTSSTAVSYDVFLGLKVGTSNIEYNVTSIVGTYLLEVEYNSVTTSIPLNSVGVGSSSINKNLVLPDTATVSITNTSGGDNDTMDISVQLDKPSSTQLNIVKVCVSNDNDKSKTIHNQYQWTSGTFVSPLHSDFVSLSSGTDSPLVSEYSVISSGEGGGIIPLNGDSIELISNKFQSDNFSFDLSVNNFAFYRSNTLYSNTPADIATLLSLATNVAPTGSGNVFKGGFNLSGTGSNIYFIYDYRKPVAITLCYSNVSATDSCCVCGTSATYYLDGPDLQSATAVFTDATLSTKATDGWYSFGGFVRQQVSGLLEINTLCSACNLDCGDTLSMETVSGYYNVDIDLGSSIGSVVIDIDFGSYPDGVKVEYDGVTYNAIYSPNFGYINSPGTEPLYAGISVFDCSISGTTFDELLNYQFNGTDFNFTESIQSVTVDPTSVFLKPSGLGTCKMIIPKPNASPSIATMTIISPCSVSDIDITPNCPAALSSWQSYQAAPSPTNASGLCTAGATTTYYHVLVNGVAGNPAVGDIIYQDSNGSILALAGFYSVVGSAVIQVDANGVVVATPACIP
jgi:hypothetical protein